MLNSKAEWEQPAVERLIVTRELPDQEERRLEDGGEFQEEDKSTVNLPTIILNLTALSCLFIYLLISA